MNAIRLIGFILVVAAGFAPGIAVAAGETSGQQLIVDVEGMTCGGCADRIQAKLGQIVGVRKANVSFAAGAVFITHDPGSVTTGAIVDAIRELGYKAVARDLSGPVVADDQLEVTGNQAEVVAAGETGSSCSNAAPAVASETGLPPENSLSGEDLTRVVDYIMGLILDGRGGKRLELTGEAIESATGVSLPEGSDGQVKSAVLARLREYPEILARLSTEGSVSRCAEYDACSLHGDLSGATGEQLAMYKKEKEEDGRRFEDRALPRFEAIDLQANAVASDDLIGRPVVLAFLAGHCTHSIDTFPILQEMARAYGPEGLRVVGIVVNSGTAEDVASWVAHFEPEYDVWVHEDASMAEIVGSHLVPTYLFVDAKGMVKEKLVGYKDAATVSRWIEGALRTRAPIAAR